MKVGEGGLEYVNYFYKESRSKKNFFWGGGSGGGEGGTGIAGSWRK